MTPLNLLHAQIMKDMVKLVLCSTDSEATNIGIFLQHALSRIARWRVHFCSVQLRFSSRIDGDGHGWLRTLRIVAGIVMFAAWSAGV